MSVFFTSDLHIGHKLAAQKRGFQTTDEHDMAVLSSFSKLTERDKLFIVGDVIFRNSLLHRLGELHCRVGIVGGNHDTMRAAKYLQYVHDFAGTLDYKGWLVTHIPIHPQELYRAKGNIHGHIHEGAATPPLEDPRYFNVNWDFHRGPVPFEEIDRTYFHRGD